MTQTAENPQAAAAHLVKPIERMALDAMPHLSCGKRARLYRLLYQHGPGNGTLMFLPIDQGLEHGPIDFIEKTDAWESADPQYQVKLAVEAGYSAVVYHYGLADKYMYSYAGQVPLVLKINGKTCVPNADAAFSPLTGTVEDAVRLGADAIGYTLYVGSPAQDRDIAQFREVRREAERYGMPVIMWAYPRGEYIEKKGGKNSLYAIDYAARVACELGADVVKINMPQVNGQYDQYKDQPKEYRDLSLDFQESLNKVTRSAGQTMVVFSGGSKMSHDELVGSVNACMKAGATGLIFCRNMWQRPYSEALKVSQEVKTILKGY